MSKNKPLGSKAYGHISHLPGSRMGPGDHRCDPGQKRICTEKKRDKHDRIIVQEKVDGSNCCVAKIDGVSVPLTRAGYKANTSPFEQHHHFNNWVYDNIARFDELLHDGERVCGEWLMQAHGTRYNLPHEPVVIFDIMRGLERATLDETTERLKPFNFVQPRLLSDGDPVSIERVLEMIKTSGHGAIDPVEGAVWRVERYDLIDPGKSNERKWIVDFLAKYVRPDKQDGMYLPQNNNGKEVWNWLPNYMKEKNV